MPAVTAVKKNPTTEDIKRKGESYQSTSLQTSNKRNEAPWEGK